MSKRMYQPARTTRRAFTLIELLVVIAIIAILAAILFPVFGAVREQARQSSAMSNLHDVYLGARAFNEDEGYYPSILFGYAEAPDSAKMPPFRPYLDGKLGIQSVDSSKLTPMSKARNFFATRADTPAFSGVNHGFLYGEQTKDAGKFQDPDNTVKDELQITTVYYPMTSPYKPGQLVTWEDNDSTGTCPNIGDRELPNSGYVGQPKYFYVMDSMDIGPMIDPATGRQAVDGTGAPKYELHYSPNWTHQIYNAANGCDVNAAGQPYVTQLKYKSPPTDRTVITYITHHAATAGSTKVLTLLDSGTVRKDSIQLLDPNNKKNNQPLTLPMNYNP